MRLARACMCVPFFQSSAYLTTSARGFGGKPAGDRRSRARGNINIAEPIAPADALRETGERKKLKRRGLRATLAREKPLFSEAWRWRSERIRTVDTLSKTYGRPQASQSPLA